MEKNKATRKVGSKQFHAARLPILLSLPENPQVGSMKKYTKQIGTTSLFHLSISVLFISLHND